MSRDDHTEHRLRQLPRFAGALQSSDFDLNDDAFAVTKAPTEAAVLVPVVRRADRWSMILTKRTSHLKHHPGQIAFPGGKRDPEDTDLTATALREAQEEIGLHRDLVEVLGPVGAHITVTGFNVSPILAFVDPAFEPVPEAGEVESVFEVPLPFLMDPSRTRIEGRIWSGKRRHFYAMPYGPYYIWGATARMIVGVRALWEQAG